MNLAKEGRESDPSPSLFDQYGGEDSIFPAKKKSLDEYRKTLSSIFHELAVDDGKAAAIISSYLKRVEVVRTKYRRKPSTRKPLPSDDAEILMGLARIDAVIARWDELQSAQDELFSQRDKFIQIVNELLQRKKMNISPSNELQFTSRTGKPLLRQVLSSGEKQLLILLSETLLQRERPYIFIADEPELSLHVLWQEKLIASLRALNPAAQIIAATHSPDIVGALESQAIDMEELIP